MNSAEIEGRLRHACRAFLVAFGLAGLGVGLVFASEGRSRVLTGIGGTLAVIGVFGGLVIVGVGCLLTVRLFFSKAP
jgi:hypothetical protein